MPWRETCVEEEKTGFIVSYLAGGEPMTVLCERFGISRETGYELVRRWRSEGWPGLQARSRAPHVRPQTLALEVAARIVELRRQWPYWGPKKLQAWLRRHEPGQVWPAASTIGDLLRREGLSEPRRRRRTAQPVTRPFLEVSAPNDVWCIDFKGWFRTRDGERCDPLTLSDADSRYLIACQVVEPTAEGVAPVVERALREHGLPRAIRSDNGPPFASSGAGGLSRLSVSWIKLGLRLERIAPGRPQQNGRHERMHGTLKRETARPPADSIAAQQVRFDAFRHSFNHIRPHEALGQDTPASRYCHSPRPYPNRIEEPWYDPDHAVRRVRSAGDIKWQGDKVFISQALVGETVGIAETQTGDWIVRFADIDLGLIDRNTRTLRRCSAARPGRTAAPEQTVETVNHVPGP
ncbi:transposase [Mycobacterium sp. KBS0706]|uniref:integrase core domain-containing protein n=1 Tax=Mycobacterium sp. KBS0706 TaxID=2578109 RepID=UPI00110F9171|nr:integrase core domain-containing protein [Mycobacterium sp. KBS0706]TSD82694.1 transposase [Mycobacterium sp. KBS0706]